MNININDPNIKWFFKLFEITNQSWLSPILSSDVPHAILVNNSFYVFPVGHPQSAPTGFEKMLK